jgi:hypothetical protein
MKKHFIFVSLVTFLLFNFVNSQSFAISANYGVSKRFGDQFNFFNAAPTANFYTDLKSGNTFDLAVYYIMDQKSRVGLKYNRFSSTTTSANSVNYVAPDASLGFGTISEKVAIDNIAVSYLYMFQLGSKFDLKLEAATGLAAYTNTVDLNSAYTLVGLGFTGAGAVGLDYKITKNFSIGPQFTLTGGNLESLYLNGGPSTIIDRNVETNQSLLRFDSVINATVTF